MGESKYLSEAHELLEAGQILSSSAILMTASSFSSKRRLGKNFAR